MKNCIYTSSQCKTLAVTMCGLLSDRSDVITVCGLLRNRSERQATVHWKKNNTRKRCLRGSTFIYGNIGFFSSLYMNNLREIS